MLCACGCMPSNFVKDSAKINNHEINPLPFFFANSIPGKNLRCPHIQIPKSQSTHFASKIVLRPLHNIIIRNGWASRPGGLLKGLMKGPKDTKHSQSCSIMLFWCIVCIKEERRLFVRVSDWVTGVGKASQKLRERNEEYWGMNMCNVNELNELCTSRTGFIQLMLTAFGQVPWFASTSRSTGRTSGRWGCFSASHFFFESGRFVPNFVDRDPFLNSGLKSLRTLMETKETWRKIRSSRSEEILLVASGCKVAFGGCKKRWREGAKFFVLGARIKIWCIW